MSYVGNQPFSGTLTGGNIVDGTIGAADLDTALAATINGKANLASPALTGNVSVTTNSASPALLITQDGTGNALEVRDVTGDVSPFVVTSTGSIGIGRPPQTTFDISSDNVVQAQLASYSESPSLGSFLLLTRGRGTNASKAAVQNGDVLGYAGHFQGYDGASNVVAASITAQVDGTPGTNDMPGRLVFSTTADGASSPTERVRIDSRGNVGIGSAAPSARLEVARLGADMAVTGVTVTTVVLVHPGGGSTGSSAEVTVVAGTAAVAGLWLGTTANAVASGLIYSTSTGVLSLRNNGEFTDRLTISNTGAVAVVGGGTLGYGSGSGGKVTQATSKSTAVTLNKPSGQITMHNAALAAGATVEFQVNNTTVAGATADTIMVIGSSFSWNYRIEAFEAASGYFKVRITNITGSSQSDALVINFAVKKGATA